MVPYSQGLAGDGPVILKDGEHMTPEMIVKELNTMTNTIIILISGLNSISKGLEKELENIQKSLEDMRNENES